MTTTLFYDSEFTELTQQAKLISLAFVCDNGDSFYAEFSDTDLSKAKPWLQQNVIANTRYLANKQSQALEKQGRVWAMAGSHADIALQLTHWLAAYEKVNIWADHLAYDWVLLCELFGGAMQLPKNIHYIPQDLATLFALKGLDPDTSREQFAGVSQGQHSAKHNALWDAEIAQRCYHKLNTLPWPTP